MAGSIEPKRLRSDDGDDDDGDDVTLGRASHQTQTSPRQALTRPVAPQGNTPDGSVSEVLTTAYGWEVFPGQAARTDKRSGTQLLAESQTTVSIRSDETHFTSSLLHFCLFRQN